MIEPIQPPALPSVAQSRKLLAGVEMAVRVGKLKKLNRKERRARRRELSAARKGA